MLRKMLHDMSMDALTIAVEFIGVTVKVAFLYTMITLITDLHHDIALETAILIGAVDFLNGQRTHFRTVTDVKERITLSERGKKITRTISSHTTRGK
jgi:hypothetical protein